MSAVGYHLNHVQIAPKIVTPVYVDLMYAQTLDLSIEQSQDKLAADGAKPVTAYDAPEGSGSLNFGLINPVTMAILTGGTSTTTGSTTTVIDRLEVKGDSQPPPLVVVGWIKNIDGNQASAGIRVTLPNAKSSVPSASFDQATFASPTADFSFDPDANNVMVIWEFPVTAPTFTSGVIPTNLVPPA